MEHRPVDGNPLSLRRATADDDAFLLRAFAGTRELERRAAEWEDGEWDRFVRLQFEAQRSHYRTHFPDAADMLILLSSEPVGRIRIWRPEQEIRLLDIAILPEHRNRGIGTRLLRRLQAEARTSRRPLRHMVELNNPDAVRFYERLGFSGIETHGLHVLMEWTIAGDGSPSA